MTAGKNDQGRCDVCGQRIDPVAAPVHPGCEPTRDGALIRRTHPSSRLRAFSDAEWDRIQDGRRRLPRLSQHEPQIGEKS